MPDTSANPVNGTPTANVGKEPDSPARKAAACSACEHPGRKVIDVRLHKREPVARVANQFDLPKAAVERHRSHAEPPREHFSGDPDSLIKHLVELDEMAAMRLAEATDQKAASSLLGERRRIALDMAKLNRAHEKCVSRSMFNRLIELLRDAIRPFPEAVETAQRAIDRWFKEQGWE